MKFCHFVVFVFLVLLAPFTNVGCRASRSSISNQHHAESHVESETSSESINQATHVRDVVSVRDCVRYVERRVNDTVYIENEVKVYVDREKAVHDTVYIEKSDTTKVKDETNDKDSEQETIVEQPSVWQRMKEGLAWGFILLVVLGLTYIVCKMIIRRRI